MNAAAHFGARCVEVLHAEGDLLFDGAANNLLVGILQHGADVLREVEQRETRCGFPFKLYFALQYAVVAMRDQTIEALEQSTFATAAGTCAEHAYAFGGRK